MGRRAKYRCCGRKNLECTICLERFGSSFFFAIGGGKMSTRIQVYSFLKEVSSTWYLVLLMPSES